MVNESSIANTTIIAATSPPSTSNATTSSSRTHETRYLKKSASKLQLKKKPSTIGKLLKANNSSFTSTTSTTATNTASTHTNSANNNTVTKSSVPSSSAHNNRRFGKFFKKISTEVNTFFANIRSISDDVFISDDLIEDLFEDSESDDSALDKILRSSKLHTPAEESFIEEFKKVKNLDKMAELHQASNQPSEEVKSSTTVVSKVSDVLQDVIRQHSDHSATRTNSPVRKFEGVFGEEPAGDDESSEDDVSFQDVDLHKLRQEFEKAHAPFITHPSQIGMVLWQYRRRKWLYCNKPDKVALRIKESSIENIPRDSYFKIYTNLVDKSRTLKPGKRMNLADLVEVINVGWIAEEKWERAAKGLP